MFESERQLDEIQIIITDSLTSVLRHIDSNKFVLEVRYNLGLADYYESLGDYQASLAKQYIQLKKYNLNFDPNRKKAILKINSLIDQINLEFSDLLKYPNKNKIKDLMKRCEEINQTLQFDKKNENTMEIHIYFRIMEKLRRINRHLLFILKSIEKYNNF